MNEANQTVSANRKITVEDVKTWYKGSPRRSGQIATRSITTTTPLDAVPIIPFVRPGAWTRAASTRARSRALRAPSGARRIGHRPVDASSHGALLPVVRRTRKPWMTYMPLCRRYQVRRECPQDVDLFGPFAVRASGGRNTLSKQ